jgi:hypothetical protein
MLQTQKENSGTSCSEDKWLARVFVVNIQLEDILSTSIARHFGSPLRSMADSTTATPFTLAMKFGLVGWQREA